MTNSAGGDIQEISRRYQAFYSGLVFDQLDERGLGDLVLANDIKPLKPDMKIAGPAFTALGRHDPDSAPGYNQVQLEMFSKFEPYSVEVIQTSGDRSSAHFGGLNATACIARKVVGTITDGGTRDTQQLFGLNYPVFCTYQNPVAATGRWKIVAYQVPIKLPGAIIAEVPINPGDFIFADVDGVVVVPKRLTVEIMVACEEHLGIERRAMAELAAGDDVVENFRRYGKF